MATLQIRINDDLKTQADALFASLGLDTSTAVRIFLTSALEHDGLPFEVRHKPIPADLQQALDDSRMRKNLQGPYRTAKEAVDAMLED